MGQAEVYYVDTAMFDNAKELYKTAVTTYNTTLETIKTELDRLASEGVWEGGTARETWKTQVGSAKSKLETIGENLKQNEKMFESISTFVSQFDQKMSGSISEMVE